MKSWTIAYYVFTILITLFLGLGAIFDILQTPEAVALMTRLHYPAYLATIVGWAKVLGLIGIWQNKVRFLREWAYAGLTIDTIGAGFSFLLNGDGFLPSLGAFIATALVLLSYAALRAITPRPTGSAA